jgi:hypothetical protein
MTITKCPQNKINFMKNKGVQRPLDTPEVGAGASESFASFVLSSLRYTLYNFKKLILFQLNTSDFLSIIYRSNIIVYRSINLHKNFFPQRMVYNFGGSISMVY